MKISIKPADRIVGEIDVPGDKSISHRAVMIGSIAEGKTQAGNFLEGEDCIRTVEAFKSMGVAIEVAKRKVIIQGAGLKGLKKPLKELYLGNSGTTMRLISGILAGQDFEVVLTGDDSLSKRPMKRIIEPLRLMGAKISSLNADGCAPLKIKGTKLKPITYNTSVASAQVKSSICLAGLYSGGMTTVVEPFSSRDHTERMLSFFGASIKTDNLRTRVRSSSTLSLQGKRFYIPGDISSAAFFIVLASMLRGSTLSIRSVGINPTRRKIIDVLLRMGANIQILRTKRGFEPLCDLKISGSRLKGTVIPEHEIPGLIDEIPILAVAAAGAEGRTVIMGVQELRVKETDRIFSMVENLRMMGVEITLEKDNMVIVGNRKRFRKARLASFGDHRTAMAMAVAAAASDGECVIDDIGCVNTSFPGFFDILNFVRR